MVEGMTPLIESYLTQADRFTAVVDAATAWDAPSPCDGWSATDVLDHVVSTQHDYLVQRGADVEARAFSDPGTSWHRHLDTVRRVMADDDFASAGFDSYFGPTTVDAMLANFYGFDMQVHRWDLGQAVGVPVEFTDEELDRLVAEIDRLGDMLYSSGSCKRPLEVPADAPRQHQVLGRLGRAEAVS